LEGRENAGNVEKTIEYNLSKIKKAIGETH